MKKYTDEAIKKVVIVLLVGVAICISLTCGVFIGKNQADADNLFWSGTANGIISAKGSVVQVLDQSLKVSASSVGTTYYPNGTVFDLKNIEIGQSANVVLFVKNTTKEKVNVYPVITSSPNVEVQNPMGNSVIHPNGWAQFIFIVKAKDIGPCSVNIGFKSVE